MTLKVDPVSDEYIIAVPESFVNELGWYEDTEIDIILNDNSLYIEEAEWTQHIMCITKTMMVNL